MSLTGSESEGASRQAPLLLPLVASGAARFRCLRASRLRAQLEAATESQIRPSILSTDVVVAPLRGPLILENRHTGERLEVRRVRMDGEVCLEVRGSLPPHSEGPPLHVHFEEHEDGTVHKGILTAIVDGRRIQAGPGESAALPRGSPTRPPLRRGIDRE